VLLGLLAALTGAFMLAGLQVNAAYRAELGKSPLYLPDPIHWNLAWPAGADWAGLATWSQQACYALLHVIEVGSLSRYRHYTYLSGWDDALGVATIILLPLQLASFLLAVRRKYKR
jgi:hypothetical protein